MLSMMMNCTHVKHFPAADYCYFVGSVGAAQHIKWHCCSTSHDWSHVEVRLMVWIDEGDMVVGDAAEGIVLVHVAGSDTKVRLSAPYGHVLTPYNRTGNLILNIEISCSHQTLLSQPSSAAGQQRQQNLRNLYAANLSSPSPFQNQYQPLLALAPRFFGISDKERMHLRQKLLMHLREEGDQIAPMVVVLISKIAHSDYHKEGANISLVLSQ
ncbi:hypothetical protein KIW84_053494 [Lathyrus oleraceus]|uniref:Uncharacterized protein n=1 Tax=Pisum sativum TaxID=3888 RepID=A0A9D5AGU7_PEA|nr:hypothetical protein KIW84_053494 [Pisum sativum]